VQVAALQAIVVVVLQWATRLPENDNKKNWLLGVTFVMIVIVSLGVCFRAV
jgi:hypothetical protein